MSSIIKGIKQQFRDSSGDYRPSVYAGSGGEATPITRNSLTMGGRYTADQARGHAQRLQKITQALTQRGSKVSKSQPLPGRVSQLPVSKKPQSSAAGRAADMPGAHLGVPGESLGLGSGGQAQLAANNHLVRGRGSVDGDLKNPMQGPLQGDLSLRRALTPDNAQKLAQSGRRVITSAFADAKDLAEGLRRTAGKAAAKTRNVFSNDSDSSDYDSEVAPTPPSRRRRRAVPRTLVSPFVRPEETRRRPQPPLPEVVRRGDVSASSSDSDSDSSLEGLPEGVVRAGRAMAEAATRLGRLESEGPMSFDTARYDGMPVYGKYAQKVHDTRLALASLMSDGAKDHLERHPDNDKMGFTVNIVRGTLTLLRQDPDNENVYQRHVYNFNDDTSLEEFIRDFGKDDLTVEELKAFMQNAKEGHTRAGDAPKSIGNAALDVESMMGFFAPDACHEVTRALGLLKRGSVDRPQILESFKQAGAQVHAKASMLKDFYKAALGTSQLSVTLRAEVQKREETLREINEQKAQAMAVFLRQVTHGHTTVQQMINQSINGRANIINIHALFAAAVDHARHVAAQNPDLNDDQKKEFVAGQAQLFIHIISRGAKAVGDPDQRDALHSVIRDLRLMQESLIQEGELVDLSYNKSVVDLEAELACDDVDHIYQSLSQFNRENGGIVGDAIMDNLQVTQAQIGRTLDGRSLRVRLEEVGAVRELTNGNMFTRLRAGITRRRRPRGGDLPTRGELYNGKFAQDLKGAVGRDPGRVAVDVDRTVLGMLSPESVADRREVVNRHSAAGGSRDHNLHLEAETSDSSWSSSSDSDSSTDSDTDSYSEGGF